MDLLKKVRTGLLGVGCLFLSIPAAQAVTVDFRDDGTFSAPSFSQDGVTLTGSDDIYMFNLNGVGVVGGVFDNVVDGGEWLKISFDMPAENVSYWIGSAGQSGGSAPGRRAIDIYGVGNTHLGTFSEDGAGTTDLSALVGGAIIESFMLTTEAVTSFRFTTVTYDAANISAVPLPAAIPLYASGMAILGFLGWRRKRRSL